MTSNIALSIVRVIFISYIHMYVYGTAADANYDAKMRSNHNFQVNVGGELKRLAFE